MNKKAVRQALLSAKANCLHFFLTLPVLFCKICSVPFLDYSYIIKFFIIWHIPHTQNLLFVGCKSRFCFFMLAFSFCSFYNDL